ncbi:Membrane protein OS=Rhodopirellula sallentina SM41 GN=RSSM_01667 PE=4 SV=1 [Gemmata massiliana]|uniref:Membrane protein n=1 Tax=Gemmata massiliana TaxID=1210884 RepID=A0A6P2CYL5_9BACT|nr:hypothetical protein [Gemmata massiliana]VTR93963.1 Membrane protein OS=Rhodopirellula sallentina SM41 GN=RSSM_01667 PE=4 SV=1 [Gemmata massiliana]
MSSDDDSEGEVTLAQGLKYGLGLIAIGVGVFLVLTMIEGSSRGGRVHWLIALLYYIGGKWTAAGLFWLGGVVFLGLGIRAQLRDRE